jgi:DNA-binding response OmpR family regulator
MNKGTVSMRLLIIPTKVLAMHSNDNLALNVEMCAGLQILVVDNDRDSRDLCRFLLDDDRTRVTTTGSIKEALHILDQFTPDILVCEIRFLGESVYPLLQRVRAIAFNSGSNIPILVTSTCPPEEITQTLNMKVETYLCKPIDFDQLIYEVWKLLLQKRITYPSQHLRDILVKNITSTSV